MAAPVDPQLGRYLAAIELQQATDTLRENVQAGRATPTDYLRHTRALLAYEGYQQHTRPAPRQRSQP